MRVGILGAGNVGGALGRVWARKGQEVIFGVPDAQSERTRKAMAALGGAGRAGTNAEAGAALAKGLIADAGFNPVDVGPLRNARWLESLAMLWIDLAINQGWGSDHAFKLLRR